MSIAVLDMSMSLDGYIADPNDFLGGDDGDLVAELYLPVELEGFRSGLDSAGSSPLR